MDHSGGQSLYIQNSHHSSRVQASVTCALTGKLAFDEKDIEGKEGQEVFSERKGLNLLQQKVSFFIKCKMRLHAT